MKNHTDTRLNVAKRLKIAKGQISKVLEMVENDNYCIDVIHQSRAVQHALREIDHLLLENHLQTCVVDFMKEGKQKKAIEEIMQVVKNNK
ncbi:MAG TPA: metal-sensing transcriptional repressor [Patescibacteria group bacterium]